MDRADRRVRRSDAQMGRIEKEAEKRDYPCFLSCSPSISILKRLRFHIHRAGFPCVLICKWPLGHKIFNCWALAINLRRQLHR
jgi:hypothetical protein